MDAFDGSRRRCEEEVARKVHISGTVKLALAPACLN